MTVYTFDNTMDGLLTAVFKRTEYIVVISTFHPSLPSLPSPAQVREVREVRGENLD